ncbi:MAG TPA: hypothetical protein VLX31_18150 [Streptosporangiaceae bacterium]|nr:hypothetical protein [Streptosporangiaceae bacterium]
MRIGAALALIAIGAILRFALVTVFTHGIYLHTIGDILMGVGVLGLFLWLVVWAPWARGRRTTYRQSQISDDNGYTQGNGYYPRPTPPASTRVHEKVRYEDR